MTFAEDYQVVNALRPTETDAVTETDWVNISGAVAVLCTVAVRKGNAALTSFTIEETDGVTTRDLQNTVPIWFNLNTATLPMTRATNAVVYALDNADDGRGQLITFQIDPARVSTGYNRIRLALAATNAGNIASVNFYLDRRHKAAAI